MNAEFTLLVYPNSKQIFVIKIATEILLTNLLDSNLERK